MNLVFSDTIFHINLVFQNTKTKSPFGCSDCCIEIHLEEHTALTACPLLRSYVPQTWYSSLS